MELTAGQVLMAKRLFAVSADPRRFLLAFKVLDGSGRTNSSLQEKLFETYPSVARQLHFWCNSNGKNLGKMCEMSLLSIGLAAYRQVDVLVGGALSIEASAWTRTGMAAKLSVPAHMVQEQAHHLGVSTYTLFGRLSGPGMESTLNKALIISELAAQASYKVGAPVMVGKLEERVGLHADVIFGHLKQFKDAGLVEFEPIPNGDGKMCHYRWLSDDKPPNGLTKKLAAAADKLYNAKLSGNGVFLAADGFSPVPYASLKQVSPRLEPLVKQGLVEQRTRFYSHNVFPTRLCIGAAVNIVDPVMDAIAGEPKAVKFAHSSAESFMAHVNSRLLSMVQRYVAAAVSKTI